MAKKQETIKIKTDINELVDKIMVDIPSVKEAEVASEHATVTDLAHLTGAGKYNPFTLREEYYYLRDFIEDDEYNISYMINKWPGASNLDIKNRNAFNSNNRWRRRFTIRPVLRFDNCPELYDIIKTQFADDDGKVWLGEVAQDAVRRGMQYKLREAFKEGKIKETEDIIVVNDNNPYGYLDYQFKPCPCKIYEFEGKKYVRFKIRNLESDRWDGLIHYKGTVEYDGISYQKNDYIWVMVDQLQYQANDELKVLISERLVLSGIQYANYNNKYGYLYLHL